MMVAFSAQLEAGSSAGMQDATREPELDQGLKHTVHRCSRDAWYFPAHRREQVIGTRVIVARRQGLKDGAPLYRHRETPFSACPLKSAKSVFGRESFLISRMITHYSRILLPIKAAVKPNAAVRDGTRLGFVKAGGKNAREACRLVAKHQLPSAAHVDEPRLRAARLHDVLDGRQVNRGARGAPLF
jgi:hypothetical protein